MKRIVILAFLALLLVPCDVYAQSAGATCTAAQATAANSACNINGCFVCTNNSGVYSWIQQPLFVGPTSATCNAANAGLIQWTGTAFQGCNGTAWGVIVGGGCNAPGAFSFTNQTGVALNAIITSNAVALSGFTCAAAATCTGCTALIRNGVANGTSANFVSGDTIAVQLLSSPNPNTAVTATVTVGATTSSVWSVTTSNNSPNAFSFTNQTGVNTNATITSNTVTLSGTFSGLTATCGAGCTGISRNGGASSTTVSGFGTGDTIVIKQTSSANSTTATTATVTVGGTTSGTWQVTTTTDPCAATSPTIGTVCADGSVYAGITPDTSVKMYAAPCDYGMTGSAGNCTGTSGQQLAWSGGGSIATGVTSQTTGRANTLALHNDDGNADAPYGAADYCYNLSNYLGHSDWYLPALGEATILYQGHAAIGGFINQFYWSSSEADAGNAAAENLVTGGGGNGHKYNGEAMRCVRR